MEIKTPAACRTYVEAELAAFTSAHPGWHAARSVLEPRDPLSWTIGLDTPVSASWYGVQADMNRRELLVWFGNHRTGAGSIHWIMRPAVHVAFDDLRPRSDAVGLPYSLSDILGEMVNSLGNKRVAVMRYDLNSESLT
ncbi:MAG TPA: hypothetical protein VJN95_10180 [Gemmatimonadales bacterium]|nr:hypothetical protein [Gemmatimonadales bacterium]